MTIYRSSGKNTEICEEYVLYTRNYVENVGGKSTITAKGGTTFGDKPETAKPLEITNLYVKVRLNDNYNGEFGFDWVDVDPETKQIEKIQGVPFSEVEYFYKKDSANPDLGDIVATSTDPIGAKHAIQDHYNFNPVSKHIDIPFALIKCDQEITLSAEIILWQDEIKDDIITITGDEFYEFDIIGGEKEGKTAKIKLTKAGKIDFKVKCLEEGSEKKYEFKHSNPVTGSHSVGGLIMMENNELKLKFRVIALVSSDGNPNEKAKALFKKFKDNKISDYLNKNSLNQAGYKVEIENYNEMDNSDVDDYFYAFDKEDWKKRQLFFDEEVRINYSIVKDENGEEKRLEKKQEGQIAYELGDKDGKGIDFVTIKEYKNKLKEINKPYENGGIIILSDLDGVDASVAAFSRISPINHYTLFVYSSGADVKVNYAHEIGHMLGLKHIFFENEDIDSFKNEKAYLVEAINQRKVVQRENFDHYEIVKIITKKELIINALNVYNQSIREDINKRSLQYKKNDKLNGNFSISTVEIIKGKSTVISKNVSKQEFLSISKEAIEKLEEKERANILAIEEFKQKENYYTTFERKTKFCLLRKDYLDLLIDYENYYKELISSNYISYYQKKTANIMDYGDQFKRIRFLNHQILIMRKDYENY